MEALSSGPNSNTVLGLKSSPPKKHLNCCPSFKLTSRFSLTHLHPFCLTSHSHTTSHISTHLQTLHNVQPTTTCAQLMLRLHQHQHHRPAKALLRKLPEPLPFCTHHIPQPHTHTHTHTHTPTPPPPVNETFSAFRLIFAVSFFGTHTFSF